MSMLMKQHQKPCPKKLINKGKGSKTLNEVRPVGNISKNPGNFLE